MPKDYNSIIGSGTIPSIANSPPYDLAPGTFPIPDQRHSLRNRLSEGVVVLNPEDFSVSIGLRQQMISVGGTGIALPQTPLEYRRALVLHNDGPGILYIGDVNVTTSDGLPINVGEKIAFDIVGTPNTIIYGVSNAIADVRILELS